MIQKIAILIAGLLLAFCVQAESIDVTKMGAKGDGKTLNTKYIQKAIDECAKRGGVVIIPPGDFYSGTLYLKSNVTLYLERGATLFGSIDSINYPWNSPTTVHCTSTHQRNGKPQSNLALIYAEGQENIAVMGDGTINGNGDNPVHQKGVNGHNRPKLIFFISCKNVVVKDVFLTNSPFWTQDYLGCDGVKIQGIRVLNKSNWNQDGLDIDSKNVTVSDCNIDSDDDAICLKSYLPDQPCENVTVTNCVVATNCNAIKFGTPGFGGFKNIAVSNCIVKASVAHNVRDWTKEFKNITTNPSMVSGISIECADGGLVEDVTISNISMKATQTPIFIRLSNRDFRMNFDTVPRTSRMRNIIISNITAEQHSQRTSSISAYPGTYVENVRLSNIFIDVFSTVKALDKNLLVPENETKYPSTNMLGNILPSSGFYVRHVKNISLDGIQINLMDKDVRLPVALDDVVTADIKNIQLKQSDGKTHRVTKEDISVAKSSDVLINEAVGY